MSVGSMAVPTRKESARKDLAPPSGMDYVLLITTLLLVGFSVLMVYSTTGITSQEKLGDMYYFTKRQFLAAGAGVTLLIALSYVPVWFLEKISFWLLPLSLVLLALVLTPGIGDSAGGAQRWIRLGPVRFQPGEFVKIAVVVFLAGYFSRHEQRISSFLHGIVKPFGIVGLVAVMLLAQPDFGSSAVISVVVLAMATAAGVRLRYLAACSVVLVACMAVLVLISPYRMQRVVSFLYPFADTSGKGYQLIQSLIAVGSGQVAGVGLGASQQKLFFLPAAHTDFIFAVIAEELGLVGCIVVIVGFFVILWRGFRIAGKLAEDTFRFSLAVGLTMLIVAPALLNMGVVVGLLPTKGMVLPLVGYGGSSLISCLAVVGLLLALHRSEVQGVWRR